MLECVQIRLGTSEAKEKRQDYHLKLASLYKQLGKASDAIENFQQLLDGTLAYTDAAQRLHVQCQLADLQVLFNLCTAQYAWLMHPDRHGSHPHMACTLHTWEAHTHAVLCCCQHPQTVQVIAACSLLQLMLTASLGVTL